MSERLTFLAIACAVVLGGCATFSSDGGLTKVETLARERTGVAATLPHGEAGEDRARARVSALLEQALTAESAVEIALLNNPGFRARLAELGVSEADLVQAGRLPNPGFAFTNKRSSEGYTIERAVIFNIVPILLLPLTQPLAARQFEEAQYRLAADAVQLAADTRRAFFSAVAAQESVTYFADVQMAAETASELARRMQQAGNFSALARMREQAFAADAAAQLARAKQAAVTERERLTRLLGLWGSGIAFTLPSRLPEMPTAPLEPGDAERTALETRLDVLASRRSSEAAAAALELTRTTRFVNVLHAGYVNESETGALRQNGYAIEFELPLFDWGDAKLARAEAANRASLERSREIAVNARSEVRESYQAYRTAFDLSRHYRDEIVPLRRKIADEMLLRYNGMLIGVFELIADAREQVASVNLSIQALRDFWLADTDLQLALIGGARGAGALRMGAGTMSAPAAEAGH